MKLRIDRLLLLAVPLVLAACVPTSPAFDRSFGDSVKALQAQQVRNPNASLANRDKLPDGIDGRAARETMERYERSFGAPTPQTSAFSININNASNLPTTP